MRFTQSSTGTTTGSTREAVSNTFQRFGSYLGLILRFAGYLLGAYQKFSFDNSMTKKLYNYVKEDEHERGRRDPVPPNNEQNFKNDLKAEIHDRR